MAAARVDNKRYLFHVLYQGAYNTTVENICTEFCDEVLNKIATDPKSFFYPRRDLEIGQDVITFFDTVLHSSKRSFLLLFSEDIDGLEEKIFLEKTITQSLAQKDKIPVLSAVLGEHHQTIDVIEPIIISAERRNWVKKTGEINTLLHKLFGKTIIDKSIVVPTYGRKRNPLANFHSENMEEIREKGAMLKWRKHYKIHHPVKRELKRLGIRRKDRLLELHNHMPYYEEKHGFKVDIIYRRELEQALKDLADGTYTWREELDQYMQQSQDWHLVVTARLRAEIAGAAIPGYQITDVRAFIKAISQQISHPEEDLALLAQQHGSLMISLLAKCKDWDDLYSLHKRLKTKASSFEEPFFIWEEENVRFMPEIDDPKNLPIISKMVDINEEYAEKIFSSAYKLKKRIYQTSDFKTKILEEQKLSKSVLEIDDFEVDTSAVLGRGGYGVVYKARNKKTGEESAAKKISLTMGREKITLATREIKSIKRVSSPYLVKLLHHNEDVDPNFFWVFLELCELGDLQQYFCKNIPDFEQKMNLMVDITSGVWYLHSNRIVHRDIKPENILLKHSEEDGRPVAKITDFGLAKMVDIYKSNLQFSTHRVGTPHFMAPEIFIRNSVCTESVDIFSLGLTFLSMIIFKSGDKRLIPLEDDKTVIPIGQQMLTLLDVSDSEVMQSKHFQFVRVHGEVKEKQIRELIRRMVQFYADQRLPASDVLAQLKKISAGEEPDSGIGSKESGSLTGTTSQAPSRELEWPLRKRRAAESVVSPAST